MCYESNRVPCDCIGIGMAITCPRSFSASSMEALYIGQRLPRPAFGDTEILLSDRIFFFFNRDMTVI